MLVRTEENEIKVSISYGDKVLLECIKSMILATGREAFSTKANTNKVEEECAGSG